MAYRGFTGSLDILSNKQCTTAYEIHLECLKEEKTDNNYICPDTFEAYKRWCPSDVRQRQSIRRMEDGIARKVWG